MRKLSGPLFVLMLIPGMPAAAQETDKPNVILIVSADTAMAI
jgi:hypothetical protein